MIHPATGIDGELYDSYSETTCRIWMWAIRLSEQPPKGLEEAKLLREQAELISKTVRHRKVSEGGRCCCSQRCIQSSMTSSLPWKSHVRSTLRTSTELTDSPAWATV